jgi:hypothetical protein
MLINGTTSQEDITIVHIYFSNIGASNFFEQTLLDANAQTDSNTMIKCET